MHGVVVGRHTLAPVEVLQIDLRTLLFCNFFLICSADAVDILRLTIHNLAGKAVLNPHFHCMDGFEVRAVGSQHIPAIILFCSFHQIYALTKGDGGSGLGKDGNTCLESLDGIGCMLIEVIAQHNAIQSGVDEFIIILENLCFRGHVPLDLL